MNHYEQMERYGRYENRTFLGMIGCLIVLTIAVIVLVAFNNWTTPLSENAELEIQAIQENSSHVFEIDGAKLLTNNTGYEYEVDNSNLRMYATFDKDFNLLKAQEYLSYDKNELGLFMIIFLSLVFISFFAFVILSFVFDAKYWKHFRQWE